MQVILAWPADHTEYLVDAGITGDAGDTVEVPDPIGSRLIGDGRARRPEAAKLRGDEIDAVAASEGVDLSGAKTVTDKRERLDAARKES